MNTLQRSFDVLPISARIAARVRATLRDPIYGLPVQVTDGDGYGPCRLCLQTFAAGEKRILFLYNPFSAEQEADFAGPIFIHAAECIPYEERQRFPQQIALLPIVLRAYAQDGRFVDRASPREAREVAAAIEGLFGRPEVKVVHVRNAEAKCFILRIIRSS